MQNYISYSIEKRIAQQIFPRLNVNEWESKKEYYIKLVEMGVGGFCVFFPTMERMQTIVQELSKYSEVPLLYSCDMENGMGMRFPDATIFPRAGAIGSTNFPGNAYICSKITALEAKSCGIFWNLAPVADVNSNPNNPIINIRSYSNDPIAVSQFINAYIDAATSERMLSCAKHFPGHGDTEEDSHISIPKLSKSMEELVNNELVPFFAAIKNGVPSVMVGHLAVPSLDPSNLPATLSRRIITDFLRKKLKYEGIIVTDALEMKSVESKYPNGEASYMALEAGADVLLMPEDPVAAYDKILQQIEKIDEEQVKLSFDRIINAKRWCGLLDGILNSLPSIGASLKDNAETALSMAKSTIKIVSKDGISKDKDSYKLEETESFLLISILLDDREIDKAMEFTMQLQSKTVSNCDAMFINNNMDAAAENLLAEAASENDVIIISVFQSPSSYSVKNTIRTGIIDFLNTLSKGKRTIIANFAPSTACSDLYSDAILDAQSDDYSSMSAIAEAITGNAGQYDFVSDVSQAHLQKEAMEQEEEKNADETEISNK